MKKSLLKRKPLIREVVEDIDPRFPLVEGEEPFGYVFSMQEKETRKQRAGYVGKSEDVSAFNKITYGGSGSDWKKRANKEKENISYVKYIIGYAYSRKELVEAERIFVEEKNPKYNIYLKEKEELKKDEIFRKNGCSDKRRISKKKKRCPKS